MGNPVRILRNFVFLDNFIKAFVRAALGFLIVVDSSIANKELWDRMNFFG